MKYGLWTAADTFWLAYFAATLVTMIFSPDAAFVMSAGALAYIEGASHV